MRQSVDRAGDGLTVLRTTDIAYRDGAEDRLLEVVNQASDRSSTSDELLGSARNWAERYHLDPARANVLRAFDIPADAKVLEIGAGCGALTRYLGERAALVDAVEPVEVRARVARARCADLPNVQVFVGELADVPADDQYDLVVVVGVLEYVGGGAPDLAPYRAFLEGVHARLRQGGELILAIENKLGAKYLAGAPEDHSLIPFDGVEGYPSGISPAYTFDRRQLTELVASAGFRSKVLGAFPDYKLTRTVLDCDALSGSPEADLLDNLPGFPSPVWAGEPVGGADEGRLWRSFTAAGLAGQAANSFCLVASKQSDADGFALWPADRRARYFSWDRRSEFSLNSTVISDVEGCRIVRVHRDPAFAGVTTGLRVVESTADYVPGTDLLELLLRSGLEDARALLGRWVELLVGLEESASLGIDVIPRNLRVDAEGRIIPIDIEWDGLALVTERVVRRGLLLLAIDLRRAATRPVWLAGARTAREIATVIGAWLGLEADGSWIDATANEESRFQERVLASSAADSLDRIAASLRSALDEGDDDPASGAASPVQPDGELESALRKRLELGEAALRRLDAIEKETADRLAAIEAEHVEHYTSLDLHHRLHVQEVEARAFDAGLAEGLARGERSAAEQVEAMRQSLSWRATAGLRAVRRGTRRGS